MTEADLRKFAADIEAGKFDTPRPVLYLTRRGQRLLAELLRKPAATPSEETD